MVLQSHAGDDAAEVTWPRCDEDALSCWRQCCRVMLVTVLLSHANDDTIRATWPQCDVDTESCWR
jgi:hypothetical protein